MKVTTIITKSIEMTDSERVNLKNAYNIMQKLHDNMSSDYILSPITREIIAKDDFERMCGIIDGLLENNIWCDK